MSLRDSYLIASIDKAWAQDMVIKNHYLHRKAPCSYAFGLIEIATGDLKGVVMYGSPANRSLEKSIARTEGKDNVYELTRLWVDDDVPRNGESFLVMNTIKKLDREIVVAYSEIQQGHTGYVYQACSFLYCGLSDRHVVWMIEGDDGKHQRHKFDEYGGIENAKKILGDKLIKTYRPRKHRYVFVNAKRGRRKQLLRDLKWNIEPYPKGNNYPKE